LIIATKFYDTCALLADENNENLFKERFSISSVTLHELEHIKTSKTKSEETRYKARKISHLLDDNYGKYDVVIFNNEIAEYITSQLGLDASIPDNQIVGTAKYVRINSEYDNIIFVTNDVCLKNIARYVGLTVSSVENQENIYKGYKVVKGTSEQINLAMEHMDFSEWNMNEYLIIQNTDDGSEKEMRYDGEKFVSLKLPSSKFIKGKNSLQRCALDILMNPDITVAAILGGYGSGKTFLSLQMALYNVVEKGFQSKILGVRSPQGDGKDVGYLPGTLEDKTDNFFLPLVQQLNGGEFELESLKQRGVLESNIPFYMKGTTYNETIIVVDEAEDLDDKQIRLVGTRVGKNSKIYFSGDYKQSVVNTTSNNALIKMCNEFKGNKCFATIYLGEDVRSSTSKMFASLFQE
jgi:predicted ribonuclease YlaK